MTRYKHWAEITTVDDDDGDGDSDDYCWQLLVTSPVGQVTGEDQARHTVSPRMNSHSSSSSSATPAADPSESLLMQLLSRLPIAAASGSKER